MFSLQLSNVLQLDIVLKPYQNEIISGYWIAFAHSSRFPVCRYLPKIFRQFTGAEGFLFLQDDTILNYWNLLQADKTKLWITDRVTS